MARVAGKRYAPKKQYKLTGTEVKDFWMYMGGVYGFRVVQKASSEEMKAIGWALELMGIQNHKDFMTKYTTTLGTTVYVPFEIGKGNQYQLLAQVETCVHEAEHVVQFCEGGSAFMINYLSNKAVRTHYEVEGYRTNMEMHYYFTGKVLSPTKLANKLSAYGVTQMDIKVARKHLIIASKVVKYGAVISNTSKVGIAWWKKIAKQTGIKRKIVSIPQ